MAPPWSCFGRRYHSTFVREFNTTTDGAEIRTLKRLKGWSHSGSIFFLGVVLRIHASEDLLVRKLDISRGLSGFLNFLYLEGLVVLKLPIAFLYHYLNCGLLSQRSALHVFLHFQVVSSACGLGSLLSRCVRSSG